MDARAFWRMVAMMGAFGAAAYLARSVLKPSAPPAVETATRRKRISAKASRATRLAEPRGNGHGRAH